MMWAMAFTVPELPYPDDALEPHISAEIMRIHRDKHHQAYVDKANAALAGTEWEGLSPEEILTSLDDLPADLRATVRDNVGGHYNHSLFWRGMKPDGGGQASGKLLGSGWAWLVDDGTRVFIVTTSNQESPVSDGLTPLLGIDVWEHAYYLQYENRRADYVEGWLNVVNWETADALYAAAPRPDISDVLTRSVSIAGVDKIFGEITIDDARTQATELKALAGWGPMAKVGSIARGWSELASMLDKRGAATVADLDAGIVLRSAKELWVIPPGRAMV
jgi:Fe-Mn family superoxide dismutase